ncbi:hypothetical protein GSI_03465 [Ganoderma sinense ZZ0214-1]|uniref:Extracellular membrane protein CFEM domain-containing protein n=1 Tax=Ganoderma sinense ZZ0214-1 TaxID=1077348 RepID=A0A2G8SLN4_9APHY|nr:hypothetical protein GSI_03465 [Ganoderma sinense ZZ0214-1]
MVGLVFLSVALLAGQAAATAALSPSFFKRQLTPGQIPAQCQNACSSAENSLSSCGTDLNCLCSDSINKAFSSCLECAVGLDPSTLSTMQASLNEFEQGCTQAGHAVTPITLTAANGSSGNPTAAGSNSASGAPAATATTPAAPSSSSSPSGHNGAGMVGVSAASVIGAVGIVFAAFA